MHSGRYKIDSGNANAQCWPTVHPATPWAHPLQPTRTASAAVFSPLGLQSRKVAIFVEPSPFSHISGMKNRFESLIKHLREYGDEVLPH